MYTEPIKKTLRRKPPPSLEIEEPRLPQTPTTVYGFGDTSTLSAPPVPPRPRHATTDSPGMSRVSHSYQLPQMNLQQPHLLQNLLFLQQPNYSQPQPFGSRQPLSSSPYSQNQYSLPPQTTQVPDILHDLSYIEDSYNDTLQSFESPKPKGPRPLPEYDPSTSFSSSRNTTAAATSNAPYPVGDIEFVLSSDILEITPTHQQTSLYNGASNSYDDSMSTPTKPMVCHGSFGSNDTNNTNNNNNHSIKAIPNGNTPVPPPPPSNIAFSPESVHAPIMSSSPIAVSRKSRSPERKFVHLPHNINTGVANYPQKSSPTYINTVYSERQYGASSRSPSPRKLIANHKRSPSTGHSDFSFEEDGNQEFYEDYFEDSTATYDDNESSYYPIGHSSPPFRHDSTLTSNSRTVDYNDYSNQYYGVDDEMTLTSTFFDYSVLPELPNSATTDDSSQPSSPTKRIALASALSFYNKRVSQYSSSNGSTPSLPLIDRKRLDYDLPPVPLDLPRLPFSSSLLTTNHFLFCKKVWSLSSILQWCLNLKMWLHDQFIPKKEFKKALIKLLVFHRSDIPLDVIGQNSDHIINSLSSSNAMIFVEEETTEGAKTKEFGVVFHSIPISGVLTELLDCYCHDKDHRKTTNNNSSTSLSESKQLRCYSSQCYLNKIIEHRIRWQNTNINEIVLGYDWATHWKLTAEDLSRYDRSISKRQSLIFDLFRSEQTFIQKGDCFVNIVAPQFIKVVHAILGSSRNIISINKFEDEVTIPGSELIQIHNKSLFEPLLRIMISEGKFVKNLVEIGNIYYNWSQVVKLLLLKYISTIPMTEELLKNEKIKAWVDNVGSIPRVKELKVNGHLLFISTFNSRYQHLPLQLSDIRSLFDPEDQEYFSLSKAIDGIKKLGSKVNEMKRHSDNIFNLKRISKQLVWKPPMSLNIINMGLENRKFIYRGDLIRKSDLKITSSVNHVILMDNYFIITERVKSAKSGYFGYKVIEQPIPVEFLLVEIKEHGGAPSAPSSAAGTSLSISTVNTVDSSGPQDDDSTYQFKIRYAGRKNNTYIFSTKSERERMNWISQLIKARANLCERLVRTEVYSLSPIANSTFAYESQNRVLKLQVCAPNDPLDAAASEALLKFQGLKVRDIYSLNNAKYHIIFGKVQNMVSFGYKGTTFYFVGLASGVYCSNLVNGWKKVIQGPDISKISVDTNINIVVILGNKNLRYYLLDLIIGIYLEKKEKMTSVSISNDSVSFFYMAKHRAITMLFYGKKKSNSATTNFKVLIPETDNDGVFSSFKVVKKFYVQAECFGLSIFNSSFAVFTSKGFEILELDKLLPRSIPEIPPNEGILTQTKKIDGYNRNSIASSTTTSSNISSSGHGANGFDSGIEIIRKMVQSSTVRPMGMFKLSNNSEFLLVYNDCAIFTNKHGKLSRYLIIRFDFRAKKIAFVNNNLIIVSDECIEIWSISDFVHGSNKLIQVIVGKDVNMVSNDGGDELFVTLANPKVPGLQLIYSLTPKVGEFIPN